MDAPAWFALALTLTLLSGLMVAVSIRARRPASILRWVGITLLPFGLLLTGTLRLLLRLAGAFGEWANRLVWNPTTWTGVVLLVVGLALILLAGAGPSRGRSAAPDNLRRGSGSADQEMDDIEAILRRHGID